ncbi:MAG: hypothetical protein WCQ97_09085 [Aminobacterium sp.]|jgi:hypothetical protein|uniref:hypothetical protein n=1 Tax=unclassified Aminobacterium TaxID=2685012 RepID=UPI001BCC664C|nr:MULTISPECIES: hypothetical protein [unclassified Aminobacterium]MDD2206958.1 hypothetical protein [Aminobacterium sp.]MDD3427117.1 hypothetical protein [Aminobacterium sp.]MDD3707263.1 hypothetical protein [Aminobacterium sp.]MDD4551453.1 hypothetical protein [Aminobacterium sp.]MEA4876620.1 hypothetical protein [Aminobacterium sp.]
MITAMPGIAERIGCHRVVKGVAINNPTGDARLAREEELVQRKKILDASLELLEK